MREFESGGTWPDLPLREVGAEDWVVCLNGGPPFLGTILVDINTAKPVSRWNSSAKGVLRADGLLAGVFSYGGAGPDSGAQRRPLAAVRVADLGVESGWSWELCGKSTAGDDGAGQGGGQGGGGKLPERPFKKESCPLALQKTALLPGFIMTF